jgi:hypothetical protein
VSMRRPTRRPSTTSRVSAPIPCGSGWSGAAR